MSDVIPHTAPARVKANGIELVYDTFGEPDAPPILLIMGLGCQMIDWKDEFCSLLAGRGFRVIRFDNRDVGQSTIFEDAGHPRIDEMLEAMGRGEKVEAPYLLSDLVADAVGLLDALGVEKTHVVGLSMGGMIAQLMAAGHPDRVLTLTSIMSTTGEPGLPASTPEAWACLTAPLETELEPFLEQYVSKWRVYCGPKYPFDPSAGQGARGTRVRARHPPRGSRPSDGRDPGVGQPQGGARLGHLPDPRDPRRQRSRGADRGRQRDRQRDRGRRAPHHRGHGTRPAKALWPEVVDAIARHAGR